MLRLAMKAIPLRHDAEPLEILFEDDHLLALNKPPGVLTAPKHRYMVRPSAVVGPPNHQYLHCRELLPRTSAAYMHADSRSGTARQGQNVVKPPCNQRKLDKRSTALLIEG
jgi:hypothetical protein